MKLLFTNLCLYSDNKIECCLEYSWNGVRKNLVQKITEGSEVLFLIIFIPLLLWTCWEILKIISLLVRLIFPIFWKGNMNDDPFYISGLLRVILRSRIFKNVMFFLYISVVYLFVLSQLWGHLISFIWQNTILVVVFPSSTASRMRRLHINYSPN